MRKTSQTSLLSFLPGALRTLGCGVANACSIHGWKSHIQFLEGNVWEKAALSVVG